MWKATVSYQPDKTEIRVGVVTLTYEYDDGRPPFIFTSEPCNLGVIKDVQTVEAAKIAIEAGKPTMSIIRQGADAVTAADGVMSGDAIKSLVRITEAPTPKNLDELDIKALDKLKVLAEAAKLEHEQSAKSQEKILIDEKIITDIMNGGK